MKLADVALYRTKAMGRNGFIDTAIGNYLLQELFFNPIDTFCNGTVSPRHNRNGRS
jgi:hypothetical protein